MTPETPRNKLDTAKKTAMQEAESVIDARITWSVRYANDYGQLVQQNLKTSYQKKAEELKREMRVLKEQLNQEEVIGIYETVLQSLSARLNLVLDIFGKDDGMVNTDSELNQLRLQGLALLDAVDPALLVAQALQHASIPNGKILASQYFQGKEGKLFIDNTSILEKLGTEEALDEEDWKKLLPQIKNVENTSKAEQAEIFVMVAKLTPGDRMHLTQKLLHEPDGPAFIETMVALNYVSPLQVEEAIKTSGDVEKLEAVNRQMMSKDLAEEQEDFQKVYNRRAKQEVRRQFGHTNSAGKLLTFKGALSAGLAINGALTVLMNMAMELKHPTRMFDNRGIKIGAAMFLLGAQGSDGLGGLMDAPAKEAAQMGKKLDSGTEKDEERGEILYQFKNELTRYPNDARLYYNFAEEINQAYQKKAGQEHTGEISLSCEEVGMDFKKIQEKHPTLSKKDLEKHLSRWAQRFNAATDVNEPGPSSQKAFMESTWASALGDQSADRKAARASLSWEETEKKRFTLKP